jgi:hypothetical protein
MHGNAYAGTNSGADTATTLTLPAQAGYGMRWLITSIHAAYSVAPSSTKVLSITDGLTTNTVPFTAGGPAPTPWNIAYAANAAVVITLPAGGSGVTGHLAVGARVVQG